jgi:hypothetical protein
MSPVIAPDDAEPEPEPDPVVLRLRGTAAFLADDEADEDEDDEEAEADGDAATLDDRSSSFFACTTDSGFSTQSRPTAASDSV